MPFKPNERPPKYKRKEYPPSWAYSNNYEKFCEKFEYAYMESDMWIHNSPWYIFWIFEKNYINIIDNIKLKLQKEKVIKLHKKFYIGEK